MQSLSQSIVKYIQSRNGLLKILDSMWWLLFDHAIRLGLGLFVTVLMARYLGPEKFGALSYAIAMVALFGVLAGSYLDRIVVRNIVRDLKVVNSTLGSVLILRLVGSVIALVLAFLCVSWFKPDEIVSRMLVAIIGVGLIFQSFDIIRLWFEARVHARSVVLARNVAFITSSVLKIILVVIKAPLIAFAWIILFESIFFAVLLLLVYQRAGEQPKNWVVCREQLKFLLRDGWPLILATVVTTIYMRIDQLMLGEIAGNEAVGIYSIAVRIAEVWYFIPGIVVTAVFPSIVKIRESSKVIYLRRLRMLYEVLFLVALCVAIVFTFAGELIISILFGAEYLQAGPLLVIIVWAGIAVFIGGASSQYLITEGLVKNSFYRTLVGAIINVLLNLLWIPEYGVIGAAYATLVSYFVATYSLIFFKSTFKHGKLMLYACLPLQTLGMLKKRKSSR